MHNSLMVLAVTQRKSLRFPLQHATLVFVTAIYITLHQQLVANPYAVQEESRTVVNMEWSEIGGMIMFLLHSSTV
jgi:hypothetical protein